MGPEFSRRAFLGVTAASVVAGSAQAATLPRVAAAGVDMELVRRGVAAMHEHAARLTALDRLAVVDFSLASRVPRMHLVDLHAGAIRSVLVAHGRGSDPNYTGWLMRFSNIPGSNASSAGGYVTGPTYSGEHGHSLRLEGLDKTNSNAEPRAIVIHSAWYVNRPRAKTVGKIGRSDGCFAVAPTSIEHVLGHLGTGRFLYAEKPGHKHHMPA